MDGPYVFDDKNFQLTVDDPQWRQMDAKTIMEDSSLVLRQVKPEIYVAVIAETLGVESGMDTARLVEFAQAHLRSACSSAEISEGVPEDHNGLFGTRFSAVATIGIHKLAYEYWCYAEHGYGYQVIFWTRQRNADGLKVAADRLLAGFEQMNREKVFYASSSGPFGVYESDYFGYTVDLRNTEWFDWVNLADADPLPEIGGRYPGDIWFAVTPVWLPVADVSLETVRRAVFNQYKISDEQLCSPVKAVETAGLDGCMYSMACPGYRYVEQVLMASNCAYLVSVWTEEDGDLVQLNTVASNLFEAFSVDPAGIDPAGMESLPETVASSQAVLVNQIGLTYYWNERYSDALEWFKTANRLQPAQVDFFGNILSAYWRMGRHQEGLDVLAAEERTELRENQTVQSWEALLLQGAGQFEQADSVFRTLFENGYEEDSDFIRWTTMRADNGLWEDLDELFADYLGADPSAELRIHQMDLYWKKGDFRKVADLAEHSKETYGFSSTIAYWAIDAYQELGLNREALDVCSELLDKGFTSATAYLEKGISEYRLKWYRQAKESLETSLQINPNNQDTKDWLQLVSAEMGEGDNSLLKEAIEPVAMPAGLEDHLTEDIPEGFGEEFGAYYDQRLILWAYEQGTTLRRTDVRRIQLLDAAGVSAFSSLEFSFSPLSQSVFVNELLVRNEQGEVVSRGAVKDYYVADDTSDGMISEDKRLVIPVPGLQPGYTIEATVTRDYPSAPESFNFSSEYLAAGFPVLNAAVCLVGDDSTVAAVPLNGVESFPVENGMLWMRKEPYTYRWEPMQSNVERFVPGLILGTGEASWEVCGTEFLESISDKLGASETVKKQVAELVAGCEDDEASYKAVVDWVRASFTYKPLEFGRSAYIPDSAADTLAYRYGDCKDLSVLLMEMLETAGIPASLVLVNTSDDIYPQVPTTDQFNHMIVYVPGIRGGLFVDPTDQESDAFVAVPLGLQKRRALVLDAGCIRLADIAAYAPDSSACVIQRSISMKDDRISLSDRVELTGYYAASMRGVLKQNKRIDWKRWFQDNLADDVSGLQVDAVSASAVSENDKPLELSIQYTLHNAVHRADERLMMKIPAMFVNYYFGAAPVPNRNNPFCIHYPFTLELTVDATVPDGCRPEPSSAEGTSGQSLFVDWERTENGRFRCTFKPGEFPAAQYAEYVRAMDQAMKTSVLEWTLVQMPDDERVAGEL